MNDYKSLTNELRSLQADTLDITDNELNEDELISPEPAFVTSINEPCECVEALKEELCSIVQTLTAQELDKLVDYALTLVEPSHDGQELDNEILSEAGRHISAKQKIKSKIRRRNPRVKLALKKRRMRNKMCPPGTSWSSKTNSCTKIDPKRSLAMRRAALYRRSF